MARFVLTGQPPGKPGRVAVGPLPNRLAAESTHRDLLLLGWTEVWLLPLQAAETAQGNRRSLLHQALDDAGL